MSCSDPLPLHKLEKGLFVLETFHGPTAAFKVRAAVAGSTDDRARAAVAGSTDDRARAAVAGNTDDQAMVLKEIFSDKSFCDQHGVCSINSINVGRVVTQASYYVYAYLRAVKVRFPSNTPASPMPVTARSSWRHGRPWEVEPDAAVDAQRQIP
eukprot:gene17752-21148_t